VCNDLRDNFSYIGKRDLLYFNYLPSTDNNLILLHASLIAKDLWNFWTLQDGVSVEYYDRREIPRFKPFPKGTELKDF